VYVATPTSPQVTSHVEELQPVTVASIAGALIEQAGPLLQLTLQLDAVEHWTWHV
jgi:hypothetical protein